jgi:hypothetical protein
MENATQSLTHPGFQWYSRAGLWSLFLVCALPCHVWTLILTLNDVSWVMERTNAWDALGIIAYGLLFAFIESLIVFLITAVLGLLISAGWDEPRRIAMLGLLVVTAAAWLMCGQAYFLLELRPPGPLLGLAARSGHPLRLLYAALLGLIVPSLLIPALAVLRSDRFSRLVQAAADRLAILVQFYLLLDVLGLLIVVIRNV